MRKVKEHVKNFVAFMGSRSGGEITKGAGVGDYFEGEPKANHTVILKRLEVMQENMMKGIFHEYILIELDEIAPSGERKSKTLRAEKSYNEESSEGEKAGGRIELHFVVDPRRARVKCDLDLKKCGGMPFKDLLKDLTDHSRRYNVATDNCWKYAQEASHMVATRCKYLQGTDIETRIEIDKFLLKLLKSDGKRQKAMKLLLAQLPDTDRVKQKVIILIPSSWKSSQTPTG